MQGRVGKNTIDCDQPIRVQSDLFNLFLFSGEVTNRAGDDAHPMPVCRQISGQFVVTGSSWLVNCCKCLMDEKDVHALILTGLFRQLKARPDLDGRFLDDSEADG